MDIDGSETKFSLDSLYLEDESMMDWSFVQYGMNNIYGSGKLNTQNYDITIEDSTNTTDEGLTTLVQGDLKLLLHNFNSLMADNGFSYTYKDFGFAEPNNSLEIEVKEPTPLPIHLNQNNVSVNRIGVPEAYV